MGKHAVLPARLVPNLPQGIVQIALELWGNQAEAEEFLNRPHPGLGGQSPRELCATAEGRSVVERLLQNLLYGLPA